MNIDDLVKGNKYNWVNQPERLVYLGKHGFWHRFAKVESPTEVWCECLNSDLERIEETKPSNREAIIACFEAGTWSKDTPTEQGWFWYRASYRYHAVPTFIEDCTYRNKARFRAVEVYNEHNVLVTDLNVEWWSEKIYWPKGKAS